MDMFGSFVFLAQSGFPTIIFFSTSLGLACNNKDFAILCEAEQTGTVLTIPKP
jgi:hypothetical protein